MDRIFSEMRVAYDMELWGTCWDKIRNDVYQLVYNEIREYSHGKIIHNVYNPIHYRK